jgi:hypothetical protein
VNIQNARYNNKDTSEENLALHSSKTSQELTFGITARLKYRSYYTFYCTFCIYEWNKHCYVMHSVSYVKTRDTKAKFINILTQNASIGDIHALCWKLWTATINCVAGALVKQFVISRGLWRHAKFTLLPKQQRQCACAALNVSRWNRMVTFSLRPPSKRREIGRHKKGLVCYDTRPVYMEEGAESLNNLESAKNDSGGWDGQGM